MKQIKNIIGGLFIAALPLALIFPSEKGDICQQCGERHTQIDIYTDINSMVKNGTDGEITEAILQVAKERQLTQCDIEAIRAEYYN